MRWILTLLAILETAATQAAPPNVLWLIADDFAWHAQGSVNPLVRTPNLDRLAAGGMRFDRAYCNSPVCTASRQSFLTGQYPQSLGVTALSTPLPEGTRTLAHHFNEAGYETVSIGKMHFNSNLKHGFDQRIDMPEFNKSRKAAEPRKLPEGITVQPAWKPFKDHARIWLNSEARPFGAYDDEMADTWLADQAVKFLDSKHDKPFFLMVSLYEPHSPYRFPVEYRGRIAPEKMPIPKVGRDDREQIPQIFRDLTDKEKQGIAAAYYASAEHADANLGRVLEALAKSGQAENTIVAFIGDHGYLLGQHGRFEKHCMFEEAVRSPLVVRWPGRFKLGTSEALVELIDIAPTLLDACGLKASAAIQGRSLLPLLTGKAAVHRERVFVEYAENEEAMVRDGQWKLIYGTGKRERQDGYSTKNPLQGRTVKLYDTVNDPGEFTNLATTPEQTERVALMTKQLAEHLKAIAREPGALPKADDVHSIMEYCLQPRDVPRKK